MLASALSALDFCYVTTTGRTSGKPHRIDAPARAVVHDKYAHGDDLAGWRATALPVAIDLTRSAA